MSDKIPTYEIQTLRDPMAYTIQQMAEALTIAKALDRGTLVICQEPEDD